MSCEPCPLCSAGCTRVVTPEGLFCRDCAAELAGHLRDEERDGGSR